EFPSHDLTGRRSLKTAHCRPLSDVAPCVVTFCESATQCHRYLQGGAVMKIFAAIGALALVLLSIAAAAADYPAPKQGEWLARDFKFHTGEIAPELKLHYTTVGDSAGTPVVVLHGTSGSAANVLTPAFAGELFGPGQPLDAAKYYIVIPDALGHGKSSKPSDGLKTKFPQYDYAD